MEVDVWNVVFGLVSLLVAWQTWEIRNVRRHVEALYKGQKKLACKISFMAGQLSIKLPPDDDEDE